jgi:hypothetical protein
MVVSQGIMGGGEALNWLRDFTAVEIINNNGINITIAPIANISVVNALVKKVLA